MNCLVGRIFWDFLGEKYWTDQVAHKIQKKLSKIKVCGMGGEITYEEILKTAIVRSRSLQNKYQLNECHKKDEMNVSTEMFAMLDDFRLVNSKKLVFCVCERFC